MNVSEIIVMARNVSGISEKSVSDQQALDHLNGSYMQLCAYVSSLDESFGFGRWQTNLIAGQAQYELPKDQDLTSKIARIKGVLVKYSEDGEYKRAIARDISQCENNSDKENPCFALMGENIFIYPASNASVSDGVLLEGLALVDNLTLESLSNEIILPKQFHELLALGCAMGILLQMQLHERLQLLKKIYDEKKIEIINSWLSRNVSVLYEQVMDLEMLA